MALFKPGECGNLKGRPKLSKNKFRFDVAAILKEQGCNPFEILAQIAMDENLGPRARTSAASELCSYVAPKLKHVEHAADGDNPITITLNMTGRPGG